MMMVVWCAVVCKGVDGGLGGVEVGGKVEGLIYSGLGVLLSDRQTNERTDGRTNGHLGL